MKGGTAGRETVVEVAYAPFALELIRPWRTARGLSARRTGWLVRIRTASGRVGYGECAPLPDMGTESLAQARRILPRVLRACVGRDGRWFEKASARWEQAPATLCAVETAFLDLRAQTMGLPLALCLNPDADGVVGVNGALGGVDPGLRARADVAMAAGFRVLKLKVGVAPVGQELAAISSLCEGLPRGMRLRLDANGAWSTAQALEILQSLRHLCLDAVEEPLRHPDPQSVHWLQTGLPWPVALDESLSTRDWRLPDGHFPCRRIVIKAPLLGGLENSLALAEEAYGDGVEVVVTTLLDAAVGRLAALHLAAALGRPAVHGLATGEVLGEDVGLAPRPVCGAMAVPDVPGLGFGPSPGLSFRPVPAMDDRAWELPLA